MNDTGNTAAAAAMGLGMIVFVVFALLIGLAVYVFFCFCYKRICEKCAVTPGVLIWIPIAQLVPLLAGGQNAGLDDYSAPDSPGELGGVS